MRSVLFCNCHCVQLELLKIDIKFSEAESPWSWLLIYSSQHNSLDPLGLEYCTPHRRSLMHSQQVECLESIVKHYRTLIVGMQLVWYQHNGFVFFHVREHMRERKWQALVYSAVTYMQEGCWNCRKHRCYVCVLKFELQLEIIASYVTTNSDKLVNDKHTEILCGAPRSELMKCLYWSGETAA